MATAPINIHTLGSNTVISGSMDTPTIQVIGMFFQCGVATTVKMQAGSTDLTGPMDFNGGGGMVLPNNGNVYFQCNNGDSFKLDLTALIGSVGGMVQYNQF